MAGRQVSAVEEFVRQSLGQQLVLDSATGRIVCASRGVLQVLDIQEQHELRGLYIHNVLSGADLSDGVLSAKRWGSLVACLRKGQAEEVVLNALLRWDRPRRSTTSPDQHEALGAPKGSLGGPMEASQASTFLRSPSGGSLCGEHRSEPSLGAENWEKEWQPFDDGDEGGLQSPAKLGLGRMGVDSNSIGHFKKGFEKAFRLERTRSRLERTRSDVTADRSPIGGARGAFGGGGADMGLKDTGGGGVASGGRGCSEDMQLDCPPPYSEKAKRVSSVAWEITKGAKWGMVQIQIFRDPLSQSDLPTSPQWKVLSPSKLVVTVYLPKGDGRAVCICGSTAEPDIAGSESLISKAMVEPHEKRTKPRLPQVKHGRGGSTTSVWGGRGRGRAPRPPLSGTGSRAAPEGQASTSLGSQAAGASWGGGGEALGGVTTSIAPPAPLPDFGGLRAPPHPLRTTSFPFSIFPLERTTSGSAASSSPCSDAVSDISLGSDGATGVSATAWAAGVGQVADRGRSDDEGSISGSPGGGGVECGMVCVPEAPPLRREGSGLPESPVRGSEEGAVDDRDGRLLLGADNVVLSANHGLCELLQCSRSDLEGGQLGQFMYPSDVELFLKFCEHLRCRRGKDAVLSRDWRFRRKDGVPLWLKVSQSHLDSPESLFLLLQDISVNKEAELQIMGISEQFRSMLKSLPVGAAHLDYQSGQVIMNTHVEHLLGYESRQLKTIRQWVNVVFGDQAEIALQKLMLRRTNGTGQGTIGPRQQKIVRKDGQIRWLELWLYIYGLPAVTGEVWVLHDITAYKHTETKYQLLFDQSLAAHFLFTERKGIFDCNEAAVKMLAAGSKEEILAYSSPSDFSAPIQLDGRPVEVCVDETKRLFRNTGRAQFPWLHMSFDGRDLLTEVTAFPIPTQEGELPGDGIIMISWFQVNRCPRLEDEVVRLRRTLQTANIRHLQCANNVRRVSILLTKMVGKLLCSPLTPDQQHQCETIEAVLRPLLQPVPVVR